MFAAAKNVVIYIVMGVAHTMGQNAHFVVLRIWIQCILAALDKYVFQLFLIKFN